jgi:16S rRNA (uracil1498-N3)-methyltransferase
VHRFIAPELPHEGELVQLPPDEARHAIGVLRLGAGDSIILIDGKGGAALARLELSGRAAFARGLARCDSREPRVRVTLYQGLCKGDKMDWIIQKCTELGVDAIQPVQFKRCDARISGDLAAKEARCQRVAREAAKQCARAWIPTVHPAVSFDKMIDYINDDINNKHSIFALWEESRASFADALRARTAERAGLIVGPEGGIAPEEISRLERAGAVSVTLGSRILRTETAGVAALTIALFAAGDLGC